MVFVQKWPFFAVFFLGNIGRENVFYDILERKWPFQAIKTRCSKSRKVYIFRKGLINAFYSLKRPFSVLEYDKRHFPGLYCVKNKLGKMAIFGPKPSVNPFGKISFSRLFELLVFILQKNVFPFQNIIKDIFQAFIA